MAPEHDDILQDGDYEAAFTQAANNADSWQEPPADADVAEEPVVETQPTEPVVEEVVETEPEQRTSPEVERLEQKLANMENLLAEAAKRAEQQPAAPAQASPEADEDAAALKEMESDWPTIYKAMNARIKQLEQQLTQTFGQFEQKLKGDLAPVTQTVADVAQDRFLSTIHTKHPDAAALLPEVDKWIATQPAFMRTAYNQALDQGTAQDVIDVYDTFKAATGRNKPEETEPPPQPVREKRLQQMEGVRAERTGVPAISDDDFEGAFERAARS